MGKSQIGTPVQRTRTQPTGCTRCRGRAKDRAYQHGPAWAIGPMGQRAREPRGRQEERCRSPKRHYGKLDCPDDTTGRLGPAKSSLRAGDSYLRAISTGQANRHPGESLPIGVLPGGGSVFGGVPRIPRWISIRGKPDHISLEFATLAVRPAADLGCSPCD